MHKSCITCNRMFETTDEHARMCSACKEEYEHNRKICRDYLIEHKGTTLQALSRVTGLPVRKIMVLIEDGAIDFVE